MQLCLSQTRGAVVNDLESDGTPKKNLSGYTSLLRLLLLSLITLSLWYSVGVGVSTCTCNFHIVSVHACTWGICHIHVPWNPTIMPPPFLLHVSCNCIWQHKAKGLLSTVAGISIDYDQSVFVKDTRGNQIRI